MGVVSKGMTWVYTLTGIPTCVMCYLVPAEMDRSMLLTCMYGALMCLTLACM